MITLTANEERHNKTGQAKKVFLSLEHLHMIDRYLDLKERYFQGTVREKKVDVYNNSNFYQRFEAKMKDSDSPFFVKTSGAKIELSKAIFKKFGNASNLPSASSNTARSVFKCILASIYLYSVLL